MKNALFLSILFVLVSCSGTGFPTGKAKRMDMKDIDGGRFASTRIGASQAPQMGFYREMPKAKPISGAIFKLKWAFADNRKRQVLGNSQMTTTPQYSNEKLGEHIDKMSSSFSKGRLLKRKKANRAGDRTHDSFAKDPNKKPAKGLFKRK
jgi:hypothetical protein